MEYCYCGNVVERMQSPKHKNIFVTCNENKVEINAEKMICLQTPPDNIAKDYIQLRCLLKRLIKVFRIYGSEIRFQMKFGDTLNRGSEIGETMELHV